MISKLEFRAFSPIHSVSIELYFNERYIRVLFNKIRSSNAWFIAPIHFGSTLMRLRPEWGVLSFKTISKLLYGGLSHLQSMSKSEHDCSLQGCIETMWQTLGMRLLMKSSGIQHNWPWKLNNTWTVANPGYRRLLMKSCETRHKI